VRRCMFVCVCVCEREKTKWCTRNHKQLAAAATVATLLRPLSLSALSETCVCCSQIQYSISTTHYGAGTPIKSGISHLRRGTVAPCAVPAPMTSNACGGGWQLLLSVPVCVGWGEKADRLCGTSVVLKDDILCRLET